MHIFNGNGAFNDTTRHIMRKRRNGTYGCAQCHEAIDCGDLAQTVTCAKCNDDFHSKCLGFTRDMLFECHRYDWLCADCKHCEICRRESRAVDLILCDECDRGYHTFCLTPKLESPPEGNWVCDACQRNHKILGNSTSLTPPKRTRLARIFAHVNDGASTSDLDNSELYDLDRDKKTMTSTNSRQPRKLHVNGAREIGVCPTSGCLGDGHLSGKYSRHSERECCPMYHNFTEKECYTLFKDMDQQIKSLKASSGDNGLKIAASSKQQQKNLDAITSERLQNDRNLRDPLKVRFRIEQLRRHRDEHKDTREPLLDGLSPYPDLMLFRQAQALLARDITEDVNGGNLIVKCDSQIRSIRFGKYDVNVWYPSPYPDGMEKFQKLYVCEYCLKYMASAAVFRRHMAKCTWYSPPGDEIYRKDALSVFEVDGKLAKIYCQNLCLLAKLFLDHKTLYFDVEPFLFYVMTIADAHGFHMVGYFSKEKKSVMNCNLSCILTMPQHQRKGFGRLLIEFSYLLSRTEDKIGSPERPLSDLGLVTYRNYWKDIVVKVLENYPKEHVSIKDISQLTGIHPNDIVSTLQYLGMIKYWKGQYFVYKRKVEDGPTASTRHRRSQGTGSSSTPLHIDPNCLSWRPHPET